MFLEEGKSHVLESKIFYLTHDCFINNLKHLGREPGTRNNLPGMALTPLPSSIRQGLKQRPSDHELSTLPPDHSFRTAIIIITIIL